jgi:hypothetical protein
VALVNFGVFYLWQGLKFDAPVIVHNITRKVSVNRKVYCSGDLSDDSWIEVNGVEMGLVVVPVASYPLFSLASFLSTPIDHGTSHRIVGTLTTVSWISLGWCCSHCDAWLAPYTEDDGVDDVDGSVVLVCPNACSTLSHDRVWKVETSGTFDDGSAEVGRECPCKITALFEVVFPAGYAVCSPGAC